MKTCDLLIIGGGSGGVAAAKRAAKHGANVVIADYVTPTPIGTKWGFGGTCVNVGCIPKKLMHTAGLHGDLMKHMAPYYGWKGLEGLEHNWAALRKNVVNHIRSLNFSTAVAVRDTKAVYENAYATIEDNQGTVKLHNPETNETSMVQAKQILVATGGRPTYPNIPGALEYGITSDDIFRLANSPGKTVIIGAGYIALECAGFLSGLGLHTTVLVRSKPLRGFDNDAVNQVVSYMTNNCHVNFVTDIPTSITKDAATGKLSVALKSGNASLECDTVLFAMGRRPETSKIGLDKAGVSVSEESGKIIVAATSGKNAYQSISAPNVYAIGDVVHKNLELTPLAIKQGQVLADKLFGSESIQERHRDIDLMKVGTTIFTPIEYGAIGYTEEGAVTTFGADSIEVYHTGIWPLEWTVPHLPNDIGFMKVITHKSKNNGNGEEPIIGFHVVCPNAGEVTQGVVLAMQSG
eukprot:PhF_6_TR40658/c0_g1_i1/m.61065/K22182/TXNRD; thioredoxin reductase (NADPH)